MNPARLLAPGTRARNAATVVGLLAVLLIVTQFLMPARGGGRGTPMAIVFIGLVLGLVNSLVAAGIILIYRTTRIINFAQTAIGTAGGWLVFEFVQYTKVPFFVAFVLGLVAGALVGLLFDLVFGRRFFSAPRLVLTVITIAVAEFLTTVSRDVVQRIPFFPKPDDRTTEEAAGNIDLGGFLPFRGLEFQVGDLRVNYGFPELFAIEMSLLALLLLAVFFRFTRAGVAVRAVAENTERAALLGISTGILSSVVWAMAGVLSAMSITLTGMIERPGQAAGFAPGVLLPALAAAVIARMRSFPVAVAAAVALSILHRSIVFNQPDHTQLSRVIILVIIAVALALQRRGFRRSEEGATVSWEASEEVRPVPKELASVPTVRYSRYAIIAVAGLALLLYPMLATAGPTNLGGVVCLYGIVALSLVVLTGWAGQVSLGQFGLMAIGAVVGAALTGKLGWPFWVAVPVATAITAVFAGLVGIPALRVRGLFLAVTTFAFAFAVSAVLFEERYFDWLLVDEPKRPTLFFLDFEDERSMYFLCVAALAIAVLVLVNLRRSRTGRVLIAVRENEANLQSFGVTATRAKLQAFVIAGALAGFAGAIFAHQSRGLSNESFAATLSVEIFVFSVLGGISSIGGALLGVGFFRVMRYFFSDNLIVGYMLPFLPLLLLYSEPGGMSALLTRMRDAVLRIIAQRRQIIVPSLFADYDPDALARRLIPLGEADANAGLAALPAGQRFAMASELYQGTGERIAERLTPAKPDREAAAIGAAAESMGHGTIPTPAGPGAS